MHSMPIVQPVRSALPDFRGRGEARDQDDIRPASATFNHDPVRPELGRTLGASRRCEGEHHRQYNEKA